MVRTYTRFVLFGKNFLWLMVAGIVALVVWIGSNNTGETGARMVFSNIPKSEELQNMMLKPHYQGVDAHNRPYTVTAEKGTQKDKDTVLLDTLRADMATENGAWMALNAGQGELNTSTKQLELLQGVEMFYEGGYQFRTDRAHVDINEGAASGNTPIQGQGPSATLEAKRFSAKDRGKIIYFNDSVRMLIYPAKK